MKKIIFSFGFSTLFTLMSGQVVINEYSASNLTGYSDNYQSEEDWIELYNTGISDENLSGYFLSDKPDNPAKWEIPAGTILPAENYLIFWCSGRDEYSDGHFHTNFKLHQTRNTQEHVVFSSPSGDIINDLELQKTQLEHSIGRSPDGSVTWKIFTDPTLGEENNGSSYTAYAASPVMSLEAGFYSGAQSLTLTTNELNSEIHYTQNGNVPFGLSPIYSQPLSLSHTQIVKAIVKSNDPEILPGFLTFNTYFIDENHSLPVLSTSANQLTILLNGNQSLRPHGTIEYFDTDGDRKDFGYGEYNKHGQDSWAFPQRSFDYIARDEMGYHDAIREKLLSLSDREVFQRIIIRASGDDNYPGIDSSAHMRDIFIQKMANKNKLNVDMRRGERCVVYANGQFWGIYSIREKVSDADYTDFYYGQDKYNIQYLMNWGGTWAQYGGQQAFDDWDEIHDYALNHDLSVQSNYQHVADEIDVTSLVDYIIINSFVVCTDWINWNTSWWRGLNPEGTHLKWGYILWDEDATFNHYINYTNVPNEDPDAYPCYPEGIYLDPEHHIDLLNKLLENDEFSQYYITRYMDLLNTAFQENDMIEILEGIENSITHDMPQHINRWGGNMNEWHGNVQKIKDFIHDRIDYFPEGLNSCYNLTGPFEVTLEVQPANAGQIKFNSLTLDQADFPWTSSYHGQIDMTITSVSSNEFDHWDLINHEVPNPYLTNIRLDLAHNEVITAIYSSNETPFIVINEINYNSSDNFDSGDWVELYNPTNEAIDIGNWIFRDEDDAHLFSIPQNTILDAEDYLVLANDISSFTALYTNVTNYLGELEFGLSGAGEMLRLYNPDSVLIDMVLYDDSFPWPEEPDGMGSTLELITPFTDNGLAESWAASYPYCNGTPGGINSVSIQGDINQDGFVNVVDVLVLVNFVLNSEYNESADINNDSIVNILDVIQLVNIILGPSLAVDATTAKLYRAGDSFYISGNGYIGAVQMTLTHDSGFNIILTNHALVSEFRTIGNSTTLIVVNPESEEIFSTLDNYVIENVIVTNSSQILNVNAPAAFQLGQAYPNPFNPATKIDFTIPDDSFVSIRVYDLRGQEIAALADHPYSAGYHAVSWNAASFSSGIYFVKMEAGEFISTRKLMLIK